MQVPPTAVDRLQALWHEQGHEVGSELVFKLIHCLASRPRTRQRLTIQYQHQWFLDALEWRRPWVAVTSWWLHISPRRPTFRIILHSQHFYRITIQNATCPCISTYGHAEPYFCQLLAIPRRRGIVRYYNMLFS